MNEKNNRKSYVVLSAITMTILMVAAVGISNSYAMSSTNGSSTYKISPANAAVIAANHIQSNPSSIVKIDLDNENGSTLYSITIVQGNQEFDVKVDPHTGQVLKVEQDPVGTDTQNETDDETDTNDGLSASDGDGEINDDTK